MKQVVQNMLLTWRPWLVCKLASCIRVHKVLVIVIMIAEVVVVLLVANMRSQLNTCTHLYYIISCHTLGVIIRQEVPSLTPHSASSRSTCTILTAGGESDRASIRNVSRRFCSQFGYMVSLAIVCYRVGCC